MIPAALVARGVIFHLACAAEDPAYQNPVDPGCPHGRGICRNCVAWTPDTLLMPWP